MLTNNVVSAAAGFIPILGDVVLAAFKANSRNAALLEEYLRIRGDEFLKFEAERTENPQNVKPGAGREADERVPGKEASQSSGGWFRRLSRGSNKSGGKSKDPSPTPGAVRAAGPPRRESRFIEDVPETVNSKAKKS